MIYFIVTLGLLSIALLFRILILEAEKQYWMQWRQTALELNRRVKLLTDLSDADNAVIEKQDEIIKQLENEIA